MSVATRPWTTPSGEEREAYVVRYTDAEGKRRLKTFPFTSRDRAEAKKKAEAYERAVLTDVQQGTHIPDAESITIAEAAELWHMAVKRGRNGRMPAEASTLRQYRQHIDLHIVPELGSLKLSKLTSPRVGEFRGFLLETRSRALAKKVLVSLKSMISEAQAQGKAMMNVALPISIQGEDESRHAKHVVIPTRDEIRAVLAKLNEFAEQTNQQYARAWRRYRAMIYTAIHTGCRASELRGAKWFPSLDQGIFEIVQRADEQLKIGSTKSRTSRREIAIPPSLVTLLQSWRKECPKGNGELMFPNWKGNVEALANIHTRAWKPLEIAAGLTKPALDATGRPKLDKDGNPVLKAKYDLHSLRHFHASMMIADNANPKEVQAELGHSTIRLTYDLYGHLFKDQEADRLRSERAERLSDSLM